MRVFKICLAVAPLSLLFPATALAMPDDAAELREILANEYGGNPVAYVNDEPNDFRRMGCRGETEMLQVLMDAGMRLSDIESEPRIMFMHCAIWEDEPEILALAIDPDSVAYYEEDQAGTSNWVPLQTAIERNNYEAVSLVLANGGSRVRNRDGNLRLTHEEHLLLAAEYALDRNKRDAIRAFRDSGFGYFLDQAANRANVDYVETRARGGRSGDSGGGGGGLLGAIAGGVAGAYLGGAYGAGAGILLGATEGGGEADNTGNPQVSGPLQLQSNRAVLGLAYDTIRTTPRGLQVMQVQPDGPADIAGLQQGDLIVGIAGEPVASHASLYLATRKAFGLPEFEVEYLRGGQSATAIFGRPRPEEEAPVSEKVTTAPAVTETVSGSDTRDIIEELDALGDLRDRGILSDEEFEEMKDRILQGV